MLVEFLSVENMDLDTIMKYLPCLPRKIIAILLFDLINRLIRSIMQNATFLQISMGGGGFNNQTGPILFHIYPLIYINFNMEAI